MSTKIFPFHPPKRAELRAKEKLPELLPELPAIDRAFEAQFKTLYEKDREHKAKVRALKRGFARAQPKRAYVAHIYDVRWLVLVKMEYDAGFGRTKAVENMPPHHMEAMLGYFVEIRENKEPRRICILCENNFDEITTDDLSGKRMPFVMIICESVDDPDDVRCAAVCIRCAYKADRQSIMSRLRTHMPMVYAMKTNDETTEVTVQFGSEHRMRKGLPRKYRVGDKFMDNLSRTTKLT